MSDNVISVSVSEWDALHAQLQQALAERDAARKWAAAWKQAAKYMRSIANAENPDMQYLMNADSIDRKIEAEIIAQRDAALRVVAAARDWIETGQSPYHEGLVAAVREWEAQAQVRE